MSGRIVLFGATGYTGELTARALVARGLRPVLAGRSQQRLHRLADQLGVPDLETAVADVDRPGTVRALIERGDVLISTVGPFVRWGAPAIEAAIDAGATYIDSTGEPAFIRRVFEHYGPRAGRAGCALLPAMGYDWVPGNLAGALALRDAGPSATRIEIGYFGLGPGGKSGGTQASFLGAALEPSFTFRDGRIRRERAAARVRTFELPGGERRRGVSVGASESFSLPSLYPDVRDVEVFLGMPGWHVPLMPVISAAIATVAAVPPARRQVQARLARSVQGSTGGPDREVREQSGCVILATAYSAAGDRLSEVRVGGVNPYTFTGEILAWAATEPVAGTGALGPVAAFGLDHLQAGALSAGITA